MDFYSLGFFALAIPAVIFAGISKGGFGSGAAFASASILAIVIPPGMALGLMLPLLMLIDLASLRPYWRKWSWYDTRLLVIGGVPGTALGAAFYTYANPDMIRLLIGTICLVFVAWQVGQARGLIPRIARKLGPVAGMTAGVGVGFTSFVSHAGGPVAAVYLLTQRLDKTTYQATTVILFWSLNVMKAAVYAGLGILSTDTLSVAVMLAPFALLGTWMGVRLHHLVRERVFFAITYVLLTVTGAKLVFDAVA